MPSRFPLSSLQPGMVLKAAISYEGGLLLNEGTKISERHLKQMVSWNIDTVETEKVCGSLSDLVESPAEEAEVMEVRESAPPSELPKGYEADGGKSYVVEGSVERTGHAIVIDRDLIVSGTVEEGAQLTSSGSIKLLGYVKPGARIVAGKELLISQKIVGTEEAPISLEAETISLDTALHAVITARQNVCAQTLAHCKTRAGQEVIILDLERGIVAGETEAGHLVRAEAVAGDGASIAVLRVLLTRQKQLFLSIAKIEKALSDKKTEMTKLAKTIEVVQLLGDKVTTLPPAKKQELALQSKRFMEIRGEIPTLESTLQRVRDELESDIRLFDQCPLQLGRIAPTIEIALGAASLRVSSRQNATGYYLKNGRILALSR